MSLNHSFRGRGLWYYMVLGMCVVGLPCTAFGDFRTIALSGDSAAGTSGQYVSFGAPILNAFADVAFPASINDVPFNGSTGLWIEEFEILDLVVLADQVAPDTGGSTYDNAFFDPNMRFFLSDIAQVAFSQTLDSFNTRGIFSQTGAGDAMQKVANGGDPAPDTTHPGRVFQTFLGIAGDFNSFGETAFHASMPPTAAPGNFPSQGIWFGNPDVALTNIAEVGDIAPGAFTVFAEFGIPATNELREVAFMAKVGGGGSSAGIWKYDGTLVDIARSGQAAPGTATNFSILFDDLIALNDQGDVGFSATLSGLIAGNLRDGIWVHHNGSVRKVVFESEAAPGTGSTFEQLDQAALGLDDDGDAFFIATLLDGRRGLFGESEGLLQQPIILSGDTAPQMPGHNILNVLRWTVNASGQVAFLAQLSDSTNAIFAQDPSGILRKVIAVGDTIEVLPGDFRVVQTLNFMGLDGSIGVNGTNVTSGFNAAGWLAFAATFEPSEFFTQDLTGVFITQVIPEPASLVLFIVGASLLYRRR